MNFKSFCEGLSDIEMKVVINDYLLYKKEGHIEDCFLRRKTAEYLALLGDKQPFDATWMEMLAREAMMRFAVRYINHPLHAEDFE